MPAFRGDKFFLSNFYPCSVEWEGLKYPSSEHAFVAAKTLDIAVRQQVRRILTPASAKKFGRSITLRPYWDVNRLRIMKEILICKFSQNENLKVALLATGNEELIEANEWGDTFWGVCNGVGSNHLGRLLMELREDLRCL